MKKAEQKKYFNFDFDFVERKIYDFQQKPFPTRIFSRFYGIVNRRFYREKIPSKLEIRIYEIIKQIREVDK